MVSCDENVLFKIEEILDTIRPHIQRDGGNVTVLEYKDGIVYVRLEGACIGCPVSEYTFRYGIQETLKAQLTQVKEVILVGYE